MNSKQRKQRIMLETFVKTVKENTAVKINYQSGQRVQCTTAEMTPDMGTLLPLHSTQTAFTTRGDDRGMRPKCLDAVQSQPETKGGVKHV